MSEREFAQQLRHHLIVDGNNYCDRLEDVLQGGDQESLDTLLREAARKREDMDVWLQELQDPTLSPGLHEDRELWHKLEQLSRDGDVSHARTQVWHLTLKQEQAGEWSESVAKRQDNYLERLFEARAELQRRGADVP